MSEEERYPHLTFEQAQEKLLELPDGYHVKIRRSRPREDGTYPASITWDKQGDPPPPFEKFYHLTPLDDDQLATLRKVHDSRVVLSAALQLSQAYTREQVQELEQKLEQGLGEAEKRITGKMESEIKTLRETISGLAFPPSEGAEKENVESDEKNERSIGPAEFTRETEVEFGGIMRTLPVNPVMSMYYVCAIHGGFGPAFKRDPRKYSMEQFLTEVLIEFFNLYGWRLTIEHRSE